MIDRIEPCDLLPCAGCGDPPLFGFMGNSRVTLHYVHCADCGTWINGESPAHATGRWNAHARGQAVAA